MKKKINIFIVIIILEFFLSTILFANENLKILLTSNSGAEFSTDIKNQENNDKMIQLASMLSKSDGYYFDLGNAFYPGILSKYSFGGVIVDYFNYTKCVATLISSNDLRIGIDSFQFLKKSSKAIFLSSNITQNKRQIFLPYKIIKKGNLSIAFIGISSGRGLFNVAEKKFYKTAFLKDKNILTKIVSELKKNKVEYIVLLSGLSDDKNFLILKNFKDLDLIISGGDHSGILKEQGVSSITFRDRRKIFIADKKNGFYKLNILLEKKRISIVDKQFVPIKNKQNSSDSFKYFISRITRWKKEFNREFNKKIAATFDKNFYISKDRIANFLRAKFSREIAIIKNKSILKKRLYGKINLKDVIASNNDNYPIFLYKITGAELAKIAILKKDFFVSGLLKNKIQGYPLDFKKRYSVVSTQSVYDVIVKLIKRKISYQNKWKNISELIIEDLKGKGKQKVFLKKDFSYLENSFRFLLNFYGYIFFNKSDIKKDVNISVPPGNPEESFINWGIESKLDFTIYNRYNFFLFTPYVSYSQFNDDKISNVLRGTFYYLVNLDFMFRPYHKFQIDSVLLPTGDNLRPTIIRDTLGAELKAKYITGRIGFGIDKQIVDNPGALMYGFETIIKFEISFLKYFKYILSVDSFFSIGQVENSVNSAGELKGEIDNELDFKFSEILSIAIGHKFYYNYSIPLKESYFNSKFILALKINTDFKF